MADVKSLIKKRASIKAKVTLFSNYIQQQKPCGELSELQVIEIEYRLTIFESLYENYDALQSGIEELVEPPDDQDEERAEFEKLYYSSVAAARHIVTSSRAQLEVARSEVSSSDKSTHKQRLVRLPTIDLRKFSGSYHEWPEFKETYVSIIHENIIDPIHKLHYLRASLTGSASLVLDNLDFKSDNYDTTWELLSERYDNKKSLVNNHMQALFNLEPITIENSESSSKLIDVTRKILKCLQTLGQPVEQWDTIIIHLMSNKLDKISSIEIHCQSSQF